MRFWRASCSPRVFDTGSRKRRPLVQERKEGVMGRSRSECFRNRHKGVTTHQGRLGVGATRQRGTGVKRIATRRHALICWTPHPPFPHHTEYRPMGSCPKGMYPMHPSFLLPKASLMHIRSERRQSPDSRNHRQSRSQTRSSRADPAGEKTHPSPFTLLLLLPALV